MVAGVALPSALPAFPLGDAGWLRGFPRPQRCPLLCGGAGWLRGLPCPQCRPVSCLVVPDGCGGCPVLSVTRFPAWWCLMVAGVALSSVSPGFLLGGA